eukprot:5023876-Amphidinium_carterae.1
MHDSISTEPDLRTAFGAEVRLQPCPLCPSLPYMAWDPSRPEGRRPSPRLTRGLARLSDQEAPRAQPPRERLSSQVFNTQ